MRCTPEGGTPVVAVAGYIPERGMAAVEMVSVGGIVEVREMVLVGDIVGGWEQLGFHSQFWLQYWPTKSLRRNNQRQ